MAYNNSYFYTEYPLNVIFKLGEFPWNVDLKLVEENFDAILTTYFEQDNCFLNDKEKTIILERYKNKRTLDSIGQELGLTKERVRQLESRAFKKLEHRKEIFYASFDEYTKNQELYKMKREELNNKIDEINELIAKASSLLLNGDTTIKELKEFFKPYSSKERDLIISNYDIRDLDLSVRATNCLIRSNIRTIKELSKKSVSDLLKVRNLGRKCVKEIIEQLEQFDIKLREE